MSAMATYKLTVTNNGVEETHEVNVTIADLARFDILRNRNGYPAQEDAQYLFMILISYCSLVRNGIIASTVKPDDFINTVVNIEPEESEDVEPVKS